LNFHRKPAANELGKEGSKNLRILFHERDELV
jgi:hypothetical protein